MTEEEERDALVRALEKAKAKSAKAHRKAFTAGKAATAANRAIMDFDEARRKPTFSECVVAMGVGAVLRNRESGTTYVKAGPGAWTNGLVGSLVTAEATYFKDAHHWIVLTEGIDE